MNTNLSNIVFNPDSPVPIELQVRIIDNIKNDCPRLDIKYLAEIESIESVEEADNGIRNLYYTTLFKYSFIVGEQIVSYKFSVKSVNFNRKNSSEKRYLITSMNSFDSELN